MTINVFGGGSSSAPVFPVQRSVRLRSSAGAYLTRTFGSGSTTTWTFSAWIKRTTSGSQYVFNYLYYAASGPVNNQCEVGFNASGNLIIKQTTQAGVTCTKESSAIYRDPSAWYHIVGVWDTSNATASDRLRIYMNGVRITSFSLSTDPSLNQASYINTAAIHGLQGQYDTNGQLGLSGSWDGYLAEVNFIDGQALTPTSFGSYNSSTGVWQPIKYSGTYGTNGFYLNFQDNSAATAAAIGKDSSGNGNNWTPNNISVTAGVTYDSMLDVPTLTGATNANFATLNALAANTTTLPTQGNLYLGTNGPNNFACVATMGVSSGKWYWELKPDSGFVQLGVTSLSYLPANVGLQQATTFGKIYYGGNGQKYDNGTSSAYGATFTSTDLIGVALDLDVGTLTFYKNNVSQGTAFTGLSGTYFPAIGASNTYNTGYINFGQQPFSYTPPTGFKSLNTYNLPDSTIPNGATQFAATLYTGTGSALSVSNAVNGKSFQPDLVWMKERGAIQSHVLEDSVRGATKYLSSDATSAEVTDAQTLTAFNSNGFSIGTSTGINASAHSYAAWQWKAGGTAVTNTSGSISSQVSANPSAGFSIVTYTGTGANATVGHGLGVAPKMVIVKGRSIGNAWGVWQTALAGTEYLILNTTAAKATAATLWNSTTPTSSVFSLGTDATVNGSASTYVAYCFSEIAGFSKFGSYTGNGSTDGPFVYLGFRPRFIMVKNASLAGSNWCIEDTSRDTYNATGLDLQPNVSDAEVNNIPQFDILSNGFKLRATTAGKNGSGNTIIYAAFAENPFKNSLAR